jgi:CubicO group peptidase (beta-lactamase class C family)
MSESNWSGRGVLLSVAVALSITLARVALGNPALDDLQRYIDRALPQWQTPGVSVALVKGGRVILSRGFGDRSINGSGRVDENTLFGIGSCSKAFGAASVAALVSDGTVGWDEPLRQYLPELQLWDPWVTEHITVRDMLSHRTGTSLDVEANGMPTIQRAQEWVTRLRYAKPVAGFREKYVYSNAMYVASALMVERLSGRDWDTFAAERLWRPLKMARTNGSLEHTQSDPNHADPHFLSGGHLAISKAQLFVPGTIPATGNVMSTAHDMGRWLLFQLGDGTVDGVAILPAPVVEEMHLPQIPIRGGAQEAAYYFSRIDSTALQTRDWSYGMGWFINEYRDRKLVWHGGTVPGFRCMVGFMPQAGLGVYIGANRTSLLPVALFFRALDALLEAPATDWSNLFQKETQYQEEQDHLSRQRQVAARVAGTRPSLTPDSYAGTYSSAPFGNLVVTRAGDTLRVAWGLRVGRLEHWHYDTFRLVWDQPEFDDSPLATFRVDSAARSAGLEIEGVGLFERKTTPGR